MLLIVDADPNWRELLREFFEMNSFQVTISTTANESFRAMKASIDLVITDPAFPDLGAAELIRGIHHSTKIRPRILVCGNGKIPIEVSKMIHSHLPKPVALSLLLSEVIRVLDLPPS
jgi:DNA-binding NtrC family response regulator